MPPVTRWASSRGDAQLRDEYNYVLLPLVYGTGKFSFDEALGSFKEISQRVITAL